ncbi:MAG: helix-turn-helix domain-containing protein [Lachnospiraceae bacterium]|nr:helix-turn-helix domain-containing protein [Lachnospiraceae bacterium]
MTSLFEDLQEGLNQAIAFEKGVGKAKVRTLIIMPVKKYTNDEIRTIRNNAGMTQTTLAKYLGVSKKTVEAWENGRTHPTGPAYRLLEILEQGREEELSFVSVEN